MQTTSQNDSKSRWWLIGKDPDYRFSLANERTFLAWIRTALAFLAAAVGIDQFASHPGHPLVRLLIISGLTLSAFLLALLSYWRWSENEKAMRLDKPMPRNPILWILSGLMTFISIITAYVVVYGNV